MLAWHISDRQQHAARGTEEPVVPPEVATVLSVLRSSAVVVDDDRRGREGLRAGVRLRPGPRHRAGRPTSSAELVRQVRRDGQIRETELVMDRAAARPPRHVTARVAPLGSRLVLALVEDRTRERRVEAVRRDFVANVSHELKTPVGAIKLLAEAVTDAADDPEAVKRFAGRMLTESDRLTRLVQQIIELSRLQGDDPLETPTAVDVDDVIGVAVDTSAIDADSKRIDVVTGGTPGLEVFGNEEQVTAAVANLVANAVSYSGDDSTVLVIDQGRRRHASRSRSSTRASASRHDEIDRIFERFYRVDPARHRSTGGTGLGLSIVKHVAATHGGDVTGVVRGGQGSTFTLTLPQHAHHGAEGTEPRESTLSDPSTRRRGRGELQRGPRLHAPQGGLRGRDRGRRQRRAHRVRPQRRRHRAARPDAARASPAPRCAGTIRQTSNVPVIMVSAKDDEVDKVVGLELGADDYVTKPYSPARAGRPDPRRAAPRHTSRTWRR